MEATINKIYLMNKLFYLCMSKNRSLKVYLSNFNEVTDQLYSMDVKFDEQ